MVARVASGGPRRRRRPLLSFLLALVVALCFFSFTYALRKLIYTIALLGALPDVAPENMLFVDDRPTNLDAAAQVGMSTVRFGSVPGGNHPVVEDFGELQRFIFNR